MDKYYSYRIDKSNKILFQKYKGDITILDILELMRRFTSELDFSVRLDNVVDFRNCNLNIEPKEIPHFVKSLENENIIIGKRTDIYITNKPNEVVLTTLFLNEFENNPIKKHIITEIDSAVIILSRPNLDKEKLEKILKEI